jgi:Carboxypeptidase regulatory-like domain/Putative zinc-finger
MSEFNQPGQHPDADQLSAFAEDALPAHEREQTLTHLAGCADCRTIVSLALPPLEDVPQVQPVAERRPWFYGWNVAWLAGAGLAALIFLSVHIRNSGRDGKIAGTPDQTAEVRTAPPPQALPMAPAITSAAPAPAKRAAPPVAVPRTADSVEALKAPVAGATISGRQIDNLPIQGRNFIVQPQQQQLTQQQQAGASHGYVFGGVAGAGVGGGVARDDRSRFAQRGASNESNKDAAPATAAPPAPVAPPPVMNAQVQRAPASPAGAATYAPQTSDVVTVDSAGMQMETTNASVSTVLSSPGLVNVRRLPSHLAIASTITRANQTLALDTAGALFLSTDAGRHWKGVAAPWPGRAVKIELASLPMLPAKQPANNFIGGSAIPTPSVIGVVTDSSGTVIPGVSIRVTDTRTGIARTATSDHNGHYAVGGLAPDTYQIDASAPGFQSQRTTVTLAATQQSVVSIKLMVGAVSESVEVTAAAPVAADKAEKKVLRDAKAASLSGFSVAFEITTDSGEIWTSADGENWTHK